MRVALAAPWGLLLAACAAAPGEIAWSARLDDALAEARRDGKPLYVLSVFGDLSRKC